MLIDAAAEYEHYSADVTRTFPVNGKFTKEQAEIYQIVYDAQESAAKITKPGATMSQLSAAANTVIKDGLFRLGLITDKNSQQYNEKNRVRSSRSRKSASSPPRNSNAIQVRPTLHDKRLSVGLRSIAASLSLLNYGVRR